MATTSGSRGRSSKTSSQLTTRSRGGIELIRVFSIVVLPAWVPPPTMMLRPETTHASKKPGGVCCEGAADDQVLEAVRGDNELPDVQRQVLAGDVGDHGMQARAVGEEGVDEGTGQVEAAAAGFEHPFGQVAYFAGLEDDGGQLGPSVSGHEHFAGFVDPDFLDGRVVEEPLQGTESRERVEDRLASSDPVDQRRQRRSGDPLLVVRDDFVDQSPGRSVVQDGI